MPKPMAYAIEIAGEDQRIKVVVSYRNSNPTVTVKDLKLLERCMCVVVRAGEHICAAAFLCTETGDEKTLRILQMTVDETHEAACWALIEFILSDFEYDFIRTDAFEEKDSFLGRLFEKCGFMPCIINGGATLLWESPQEGREESSESLH
jgi:hypothetical protein